MKKLIAAAALTGGLLAMFLFARLPAQVALPYLGLPPWLELRQVHGTLWRGRSVRLLANRQPVGALHWRWRPGDVLEGALGFDLTLRAEQKESRAVLQVRPSGTRLDRLRGQMDAAPLAATVVSGQLRSHGLLTTDGLNLSWLSGPLPVSRGQMVWQDASLSGLLAVRLGDVRIAADGANHDTEYAAELVDGDITGDASVQTHSDGRFEISATFAAAPGAPAAFAGLLRQFGAPTGDGRYRFRWQGHIR